jgi:hypothetical protein
MKRAVHLVTLAVFATLAAYAFGYCAGFPTVAEEFRTSDVVFTGRVIGAREMAVHSESITGGTFYTVEVADVLKGAPPHRVQLYSDNSSGRFPMRVGKRYLIFGYSGAFQGIRGQHLAVNNCGNSAPLPEANEALKTVRRLAKT